MKGALQPRDGMGDGVPPWPCDRHTCPGAITTAHTALLPLRSTQERLHCIGQTRPGATAAAQQQPITAPPDCSTARGHGCLGTPMVMAGAADSDMPTARRCLALTSAGSHMGNAGCEHLRHPHVHSSCQKLHRSAHKQDIGLSNGGQLLPRATSRRTTTRTPLLQQAVCLGWPTTNTHETGSWGCMQTAHVTSAYAQAVRPCHGSRCTPYAQERPSHRAAASSPLQAVTNNAVTPHPCCGWRGPCTP
jgi:hypothetical protein